MRIDEANKISDKLVAFLREERLRQGMSQYKLDKECGLSKTSVAFIERNENKPTLSTLVRIADALNVDLSEYLQKALKSE